MRHGGSSFRSKKKIKKNPIETKQKSSFRFNSFCFLLFLLVLFVVVLFVQFFFFGGVLF